MLIEIFSDLVCPWCYVGAHRLKQALAMRPGVPVERRWLTFQLNPDLPSNGIDRALYLAIKFGGSDRARRIYAIIEEAAATDHLPINLSRIRSIPNTLMAHRVIGLAQRFGRADGLVEALFQAHFVHGYNLGDRDLLLELARRHAGIDPDIGRRFLAGTADQAERKTADALAHDLDLHSVPYYLFDRCYALAGAQEPAVYLPLLDLALVDAPVVA